MATTVDSVRGRSRSVWCASMLVVAAIAFALRLVPVLRGGGLYGRGNYDDGVYYAAAAGLVHGVLPYRDFLLLHPPGIVLALAPFAALARFVGEPNAFASARVAFMLVGAANALLVAGVLRRLGLVAAACGALFYAVFFPAVYVEHTTVLEPLATTCLLGAVMLSGNAIAASGAGAPAVRVSVPLIMAGVLLGASASIKIWGVVPALVVLGWILVAGGSRLAARAAAGLAAGTVAICLPFSWSAPSEMWHLVVASQLGRPRSAAGWSERTTAILGLTPLGSAASWELALGGAVVAAGCVLAWRTAVGRLSVVLLVASTGLLYATPSWFLHYAALTAGPMALVIGAAAAQVAGRMRRASTASVAALAALALLAGYAHAVLLRPFGTPFPTQALTSAVSRSRTCVTTDDPISLIALDVLQHNLDHGCRLVVDLGGYNYSLQAGRTPFRSRTQNPAWQRLAITYLRSGDIMVGARFRRSSGWDAATARTIKTWPLHADAGSVTVRGPRPVAHPGSGLGPVPQRGGR